MAEAGRRWPGRVAARAGRVPVLLAEEEGDRGGRRRWAGPAGGAGQLGRLQVSGPGRLLFFLFFSLCFVLILFSILQVCFEFGFETNSIYFASDNIFRS